MRYFFHTSVRVFRSCTGSLARSLSWVWVGQRSDEALFFLNRDRLYFYYTWCSVASRGNLAFLALAYCCDALILFFCWSSTLLYVVCTFRVIIYRTQRICHSRSLLGFGSFGAVPCLYSSSVVQKQEAALSITTRGAALVFLVRPGLAYYYAIYGVVGIRGKKCGKVQWRKKTQNIRPQEPISSWVLFNNTKRCAHNLSIAPRRVCVLFRANLRDDPQEWPRCTRWASSRRVSRVHVNLVKCSV